MNPRFKVLLFLILLISVFFFNQNASAAIPVAKISSLRGEVIVQSDAKIIKVTEVGYVLNAGDRVQTKDGEVQITFNDGAIMKVNPFTSTMIQEREEESGFWLFKTKKMVRRITCFVGKLWFKTGVSKRKNYLQTPTAVCGLRGSDGDIGFDNINTYLNMYTGKADIVGKVIKGFFKAPGIDAATRNRVYQTLIVAHKTIEEAKVTKKAVDMAKARVEALKVVKVAATELEKNPDKRVAKEAKIVATAADAILAAAEVKVVVEEIKEVKETAEKAKEEEAAKKAEEAAKKAEEAAKKAEEAAKKAEEAIKNLDLDKAKEAAEKAKKVIDEVKDIGKKAKEEIKKVVTTTIETTEEVTEETTEEITEETTEETTEEVTEETTIEETTEETTTVEETTTSSTTT